MKFNLSTGKEVDLLLGVIGIGHDLALCEGCDGDIFDIKAAEEDSEIFGCEKPYTSYTKKELICMARYGISKFEEFIKKVEESNDDWFEKEG